MFRSNLVRSMALVSAVSVFGVSQSAFGIANQHLNPHPDLPAQISWQGVAGNPDTHNHFHMNLKMGETITKTAFSLDSNKDWRAFSVWDDRFYRYADADNNFNSDVIDNFAHGYIDPTFAPRYRFVDAPNNDAKARLNETFGVWDTAAKAAAAGKTTPNGTALKTSIAASNNDTNYEFTIAFIEGFQEKHNAFAEWLVSESQRQAGDPSVMTLVFETTPTNSISIQQAGWQISKDNGTTWHTTLEHQVGWSFDKDPEIAVTMDIDYRTSDGMGGFTVYEGNEAGFGALGLSLGTNTFINFVAGNDLAFFEMDLYTIALHEVGHVLGLLHTDVANNIMHSQIAKYASFGDKLHTIDGGSAHGAALLYSIPVPEPTALVAFALAGGLFRRRR
jgi:hypothetical protein